MIENPSIQLVIPVYNEENLLQNNLRAIENVLVGIEDINFEIVVVDDGSSDNTWDEIKSVKLKCVSLRAIRLSRNFGKEAAISAGLYHSQANAVIVMDADLQHPPNLIPEMVHLWKEGGYDVVDAVKYNRGSEVFWYKLSSYLFTKVLCSLSGFDMHGASDFKLLDRRVVNAYLLMRENATFYRAMVEWVGFRHIQLPMSVNPRKLGKSKWNFARLLRLAATAITSFNTSALHISTFIGLLFLAISGILTVYTVFRWVFSKSLEGFTTVILIQLIIGGIILTMLGIIGEYLATIFWEVKGRPRYIIREEF